VFSDETVTWAMMAKLAQVGHPEELVLGAQERSQEPRNLPASCTGRSAWHFRFAGTTGHEAQQPVPVELVPICGGGKEPTGTPARVGQVSGKVTQTML